MMTITFVSRLLSRRQQQALFHAAFAILTASCVTNQEVADPEDALAHLQISCAAVELSYEPDWIFLDCAVKNLSEVESQVKFAPRAAEGDQAFRLPAYDEVAGLEKRLKARSAPVITGITPSGGSAEGFLLQVLGTLAIYSAHSLSHQKELSTAYDMTLKSGDFGRITFPLVKTDARGTSHIELEFELPTRASRRIELEKDSAQVRRRRTE